MSKKNFLRACMCVHVCVRPRVCGGGSSNQSHHPARDSPRIGSLHRLIASPLQNAFQEMAKLCLYPLKAFSYHRWKKGIRHPRLERKQHASFHSGKNILRTEHKIHVPAHTQIMQPEKLVIPQQEALWEVSTPPWATLQRPMNLWPEGQDILAAEAPAFRFVISRFQSVIRPCGGPLLVDF